MQGNGGGNWTKLGAASVVANIAEVYKSRNELKLEGLTIVPGAGNVGRGNALKEVGVSKYHDSIGRLGTIQNALVLTELLKAAGVPVALFNAHGQGFFDVNIKPPAYNRDLVKEAHDAQQVVVVGGGTGKNGVTTDDAVVFYARDYQEVYEGEIMILKSTTTVDGVYASDPAESEQEPPRFKRISATEMLKDYDNFDVVDKGSLEQLAESGMTMHVFQESKHKLDDVLRHETNGASIGTLIMGETCEPLLY